MSLRDKFSTKGDGGEDLPVNTGEKASGYSCPGYAAQAGQKLCVRFRRGVGGEPGTCTAIGGAPCVEWMRKRGRSKAELVATETLVELCLEPDPAVARAKLAAMASDPRRVLAYSVDAGDEHISRLEDMSFCMTVDTPVLGEIKIVPRYTSERCKQLAVRDLVILAAVGYAFPGAHICELVLEPPPEHLWGKPSAAEEPENGLKGIPF